MVIKPKKKTEPKPIKKVPLITGLIFVGIGIANMILMVVSSDVSAKSAYGAMVATFVTLGVTLLDKSKVLDR